MEKKRPLVSIIVRTKDRPGLLTEALKSIAGQTYRPIEVVLVNDGGCDLDVMEHNKILGDVSLSYIRLEKNMGRAYAGNAGINNAKGEYIGFLDDDDEFYPQHIEVLAERLTDSGCQIAYTDAETVILEKDEADNLVEKERHVIYSQDFNMEMLLIQNYIPFMCLLFKKKVFETVTIDEGFDFFEDWNLLVTLSRQYRFEHIRKVTAKYKQWSAEHQITRRAAIEEFSREAYKKILNQNRDKITSEAIYTYCQIKSGELSFLRNEIRRIENGKQMIEAERQMIEAERQMIESEKQMIEKRRQMIEAERQMIESERQIIESEKQMIESERQIIESKNQRIELKNQRIESKNQRIESKNQRIESKNQLIEAEKAIVEAERQRLESDRQRLEAEKAKLFNEYMGLQNYVAEIHGSIGWKLITRYRRIKHRLLPPESQRRALYNLLLKSVRVIEQEGLKGFFVRVRRRLRFNAHYMRYKFRRDRYRPLNIDPGRKISEHFAFIKRPVHIIMPVFNGYECIANCLDSVFRNTDLSYHTLVIIDDKSTDQRVTDYLLTLQDKRDNRKIVIVFNEENLGFVKTINKGMKSSPVDVIILNSDTIITANWIDKLQRAAYSKTGVATATPLSNYVTINGIPEPFKHNPVPLGMDIDAFADMLERTSLRYYPEVPAGVGFCMYIKKAVLDEMGYFDETRFEKGYAEETDFCMRALKNGYIHVLDDATYIYHIGGVSFESSRDPELLREKNSMIERNLEMLRALHPEYLDLVEKSLREDLAPVHSYINLRLALEKEKIEDTLCDRSKA